MKNKVIIIGAGISGLSLAVRLLSKGFEVEIFEKNSTIGGKTNRICAGNFKFDLTASILMLPEDYISLFRDCGKDYRKYFSLIPLSPLYRCFYYDNSCYDFFDDMPRLNHTLRNITNNDTSDIAGYHKFIIDNYKKYLLINKNFLNRSFLKYYNILNPSSLKSIFKLNAALKCSEECVQYLHNEKLISFLMFQSMYIGVSPYSSSSIYNTIPASIQMEGLYYIKGGIYNYVKAIEKLIYNLGGKIRTCSEVTSIEFKDNNAYAVKCNEKKYKADIIACSSDYSSCINNLINDKSLKKHFKDVQKLDYSCSVFMLYLSVDKKYPILKVHNIYINKNFDRNIQSPFKGYLSKNPSLYIYCPSSMDDSLCKNNYETINIMMRVPNLSSRKVKWNTDTCLKIKKQILDILSSINTLEDIKEHILYDHYLTPLDLRDNFNLFNGSAFGISHNIKESIIFRPQCMAPQVKNLYFTGSSIHPGNGISMCLKSSRICATKIEKDIKNKRHL